jgi:hypothetical protein
MARPGFDVRCLNLVTAVPARQLLHILLAYQAPLDAKFAFMIEGDNGSANFEIIRISFF